MSNQRLSHLPPEKPIGLRGVDHARTGSADFGGIRNSSHDVMRENDDANQCQEPPQWSHS